MAVQNFNFLLSQVRTSTKALVGGKVYFYTKGTTTPKNVWLDSDGLNLAANPYTLDANATCNLYGSGLYRVLIKDAAGATCFDRDGVYLPGTPPASTYDSGRLSLYDFGCVGDGVTDDTANVQAALNSGTNLIPVTGKFYCASSITIPKNTSFVGPSESIGSARYTQFNFTEVNGTILLGNSATITMSQGSSISNWLIMNKNLVALYPLTSSATALSAIAGFAGTAITASEAQDIYIRNCRIVGFALGISCNLSDRIKMEWVDIDCTAGLLTNDVYDIARIYNVHCWPFLTYGYAFSTSDLCYYRSGSAFKFTGHFDGSSVTDCFSYGHLVGYDVQSPVGVTFQNCWVEGGGASWINNQYGFKFSGSTVNQVTMIGCGVDTCDSGVYVNAPALKLNISNCGIYANVNGIEIVSAVQVMISDNYFYYPHETGGGSPNAWPASNAHIFLNSTSGAVSILDNFFYGGTGGSPLCAGISMLASSNAQQIIGNRFSYCTYAIYGDPTTTSPLVIQGNVTNNCTNDYLLPAGACTDWLQMHDNWWGTNDVLTGPFNSGNSLSIGTFQRSGTGAGASQHIKYSRGTPGAKTIVVKDDTIGKHIFSGYDGSAFVTASVIRSQVDDTPSSGSMPGNLIFSTTPSGSNAPIDRFLFSNIGNFMPVADNSYAIGATGYRIKELWCANGTIQTSDQRDKSNVTDSKLGLKFINKLRPVSFQWEQGENVVVGAKEDGTPITENKPGKRTHWGFLAQEVKKAADSCHVDFGGWILSDKNDDDSQQALRYDQFIGPLVKAVQELSAEVASLKKGKKE
jgi:hypothetical protein